MQNLLDFLARHFHWLVFLLLETVSGILLFSYNSYQGSAWLSTANSVTGKLLEWRSGVEQFFSLTRVNEELTERNIVLERQLAIYREQLAAGTASANSSSPGSSFLSIDSFPSATFSAGTAPFDSALALPASPAFLPGSNVNYASSAVAAKVVANSIDRSDNLITIDRGTRDGVQPDMGVVSGLGVVGVVYLAGEHYSVVLPVTNRHSRISCAIRGREYFGYLSWYGGSPVEAYVEDIPRHARFQKGDWVETSGYSSIFPKGVAVGKITNIYNSADGLSYSLKVHLSTDFACLRDVFVIGDSGFREQRELIDSARVAIEKKDNP